MSILASLGASARGSTRTRSGRSLPIWATRCSRCVDTHITTACVTLYLHRCQTHGSITFHPAVAHFMRFWLWVRTAMPTREWVAVHRCHHAHVDTDEDPHSPIVYGIWRVVFLGTGALPQGRAQRGASSSSTARARPTTCWSGGSTRRLSLLGPVLTLVTNVWLFGTWGLAMWLFEMAWIPFFAAGVINGLGHWWGYRNFADAGRVDAICPARYWSILTCGEALHNNHHHIQNSPRFAMRTGELDPGYWYFRALSFIGLARARQHETAVAA